MFPWWAIVIGYIVFIGIVNAYNFMDGINGITGLYSLAVLVTLQYVNMVHVGFVNADLIWYPMIASAVFLFFLISGGVLNLLRGGMWGECEYCFLDCDFAAVVDHKD